MKKEFGRFVTRSNDGKEYILIAYEELVNAGDFQNPLKKRPKPLLVYFTVDGLEVIKIDSDTFKILLSNIIVRKVA